MTPRFISVTLLMRLALAGLVSLQAIAASRESGVVPALSLLRVSEKKRFLATEAGAPFFWLGDTAWELFHRLNQEQSEQYLRTRAAQGFTVIQAVVLAELDGLSVPNAYGQLPLRDHDPRLPNETYFAHVDWIVGKAASVGLYIAMLPAWGDKWNKKWGTGKEIFTPETADAYGEWLGRRYAGRNIVWVLGGDRPVENDHHRAIIRSMATGLRRGDGGRHLMTFHPSGGHGSAEYFHDEPWLDFNMRQNGHAVEFSERYRGSAHLRRPMPVMISIGCSCSMTPPRIMRLPAASPGNSRSKARLNVSAAPRPVPAAISLRIM